MSRCVCFRRVLGIFSLLVPIGGGLVGSVSNKIFGAKVFQGLIKSRKIFTSLFLAGDTPWSYCDQTSWSTPLCWGAGRISWFMIPLFLGPLWSIISTAESWIWFSGDVSTLTTYPPHLLALCRLIWPKPRKWLGPQWNLPRWDRWDDTGTDDLRGQRWWCALAHLGQ